MAILAADPILDSRSCFNGQVRPVVHVKAGPLSSVTYGRPSVCQARAKGTK